MDSILKATGTDQAGVPSPQLKSLRQLYRVNPFWRPESRPIFPHNATGPYADPFPILTGTFPRPDSQRKGPSEQDRRQSTHDRLVS